MLCDQICACAITSTLGTVSITGSGTPSDPWVIDTANASDITQLIVDVANLQAAQAALPGTYVNKGGDTMSGMLSVTGTTEALQVRRSGSPGPIVGFYDLSNARIAYIQAVDSSLVTIAGEAGISVRIVTNAVEAARFISNNVLFWKSAANQAVAGVEASSAGSAIFTRTDGVTPPIVANKAGSGVASATGYAEFRLSGTAIGSITRNAATSAVLYNTTSDERLKTVIDDLDPELAEYVLALLTPVMFTWNDDETDTPIVGYLAQQVAKAWPQAIELGVVTPGVGDVSDRTWDADGNETTPEGAWRPWMMDKSVLIPLLHASLNRTTAKLSYLRAEFDEYKAQVEDRLAALEDK